jgi:hypothetical protein
MRTTLAIDDDVFAFAQAQARRQRVPIGEILSRLAREGIHAQTAASTQTAQPKSRFALLPARAEIITTEHVRELMDQEGF